MRIAQFEDVVGRTDAAESDQSDQRDLHEPVAELPPQQHGHDYADDNQCAAHGRRALFGLMRLRAFLADVLANLEFAQPFNHIRPDQQGDEQRGERGKRSPKGKVPKDAERAEVRIKLLI